MDTKQLYGFLVKLGPVQFALSERVSLALITLAAAALGLGAL